MDYRAKKHYQQKAVAESYDDTRFNCWQGRLAHHTESIALQKSLKNYCPIPGTLLDLPCGTARLFPTLLDLGYEVHGVDISNEMIDVANKKYANNNRVSFSLADAEKLQFVDNQFDYLTSYRLMTHLPEETQETVLSEMIRVTKKCLIVNFHIKAFTPQYLMNRIFRPNNCPAYPVEERHLREKLKRRKDVHLLKIIKLSWYERSSVLVILEKNR